MDIHISVEGRHDLSGQIYRQLRAGIVDGRLTGGTRLPSTRDLATQLGVSRKTTLDVFERLFAEGYLITRPGSGTFVADGLERLPASHPGVSGTGGHLAAVQAARAASATRPRAQPLPMWAQLPGRESLPSPLTGSPFDFIGGVTDKTRFPFDVWRRCVNHALRAQSRGRGTYRDPAGEQELRLAISRYLAFSRAVMSNWDEVLVTQGAQEALDLIARVTVAPGDVVAVEDPGYPPARACLAARGAKVVPVPVDGQGLIVRKLPKAARLVYVTPSHQFPLGMPMSLERRVELLEWAQQRGAVIVEDDYDCEFRFEGRSMEPLKSLDRAGLVAYVGTFSKTLFPELRVGYVVAPASLSPALVKARMIGSGGGCALTQTALAAFMLDGEFARHLRRMHKLYAARREMLLAHLNGRLAPWLEPVATGAGIHLAAHFRVPVDEARVSAGARAASIGLPGLTPFYVNAKPEPGLMFGYGGIEVEHIDAALTKFARLLPKLVRS